MKYDFDKHSGVKLRLFYRQVILLLNQQQSLQRLETLSFFESVCFRRFCIDITISLWGKPVGVSKRDSKDQFSQFQQGVIYVLKIYAVLFKVYSFYSRAGSLF